jgi:HemX protein
MISNNFVDLFQIALPFLYAAVVALYALAFFRNARGVEVWKTRALVLVIVCHLGYLAARTIALDHPPITSVFEIMTLLAVSMAITYLYIELQTRQRNTGLFILSLALLFQTVSSIFVRDTIEIPEYLHSLVLGFHVSAALLGYTGISLSAVYGFLFLMLYHDIKSSRFGLIYSRLPNLEGLEGMSYRAEVFGFVTLGIAIAIGLLWLPTVFKDFSYLDPKLVATAVIWAIYAVGLWAKKRFGWKGRKTMLLSLVAFCIVFFSMTVVNIYLSEFHKFH